MNNMTSTNRMNLGTSVALAALVIALFSWLRADIGDLRREVCADIGALRTELRAEIGALRAELRADTVALRTEVQADMVSLRQ